jgi:hypothetical protein
VLLVGPCVKACMDKHGRACVASSVLEINRFCCCLAFGRPFYRSQHPASAGPWCEAISGSNRTVMALALQGLQHVLVSRSNGNGSLAITRSRGAASTLQDYSVKPENAAKTSSHFSWVSKQADCAEPWTA